MLMQPSQQPPMQPRTPGMPPPGPGQAPQTAQKAPKKPLNDQSAYDIAASTMIQHMLSKDGLAAIQEAIQSPDPVKAIGEHMGEMLAALNEQALEAGGELDPKLVFQAGVELARTITEILVKKFNTEPKKAKVMSEVAFFVSFTEFAQKARKEAVSPQQSGQYAQLIKMLAQKYEEKMQGQPQPQKGGLLK